MSRSLLMIPILLGFSVILGGCQRYIVYQEYDWTIKPGKGKEVKVETLKKTCNISVKVDSQNTPVNVCVLRSGLKGYEDYKVEFLRGEMPVNMTAGKHATPNPQLGFEMGKGFWFSVLLLNSSEKTLDVHVLIESVD